MKGPTMNSKASLALMVGAFVLLNLVAAYALGQIRLDLTEDGLNTLSEGTVAMLGELEEPVTLQLYLSSEVLEDLPGLKSYARQVQALLEEYRLLSRGKLTLEKVDPLPFSEQEDEAVAAGLQGVPVAGGDSLYFGLIAKGSGPRKTIPFFQPEREPFLEYDLSRLIYAVTHPERQTVGILSAVPLQGGFTPGGGMSPPAMMVEELRSRFAVRFLNRGQRAIEEGVDLLMVVHPHGLAEEDLYAVDQFVLGGGAALVFADPHSEDAASGFGQPPQANPLADELLAAWGVRLRAGKVVADPLGAQQVSYRDGSGRTRSVRYLPWFSLGEGAYNAEEILVNRLGRVNLASAGALEPTAGSEHDFIPLMRSSAEAGLLDKGLLGLGSDPARLASRFTPEGQALVLAARVRGRFSSAFPEGAPAREQETGAGENSTGEEESEPAPVHRAAAEEPANLVIVADSDLLQDRFWVQVNNFFGQRLAVPRAANLDLVVNALEVLGGSPDLISVRSRTSHERPFELVAQIRQQAEARYRAKEQELLQKLEQTERKLNELQLQRRDAGSPELTAEQQRELERFLQEKVRHRKKLREVQYQLRADIEELESSVKLLNIGLMPMLISVVAFVTWVVRRGKSREF